MNNILHIINEYDSLKAGLKYIINNSTSNNAPYHNLNHMLTVTRHVYPIYEFTGDNILSFELDIIESINQNDGLDITSALESEITRGWITDEMDYVVLSNKEVKYPN